MKRIFGYYKGQKIDTPGEGHTKDGLTGLTLLLQVEVIEDVAKRDELQGFRHMRRRCRLRPPGVRLAGRRFRHWRNARKSNVLFAFRTKKAASFGTMLPCQTNIDGVPQLALPCAGSERDSPPNRCVVHPRSARISAGYLLELSSFLHGAGGLLPTPLRETASGCRPAPRCRKPRAGRRLDPPHPSRFGRWSNHIRRRGR